MMTSSTSVMTQFTLLLSALAGAPFAFSVSASFFWSQPSILVVPIVVVTVLPSAGTDLNDNPCLGSMSFPRPESKNFLQGQQRIRKLNSADYPSPGEAASPSNSQTPDCT